MKTEWKPIDDAPRDGQKIILAKFGSTQSKPYIHIFWASLGSWSTRFENWNDGVEPSGLAGPTHFLDLSETITPNN